MGDAFFLHVTRVAAWLRGARGTQPHEVSMRLLKLVEEVGEVGQAYIGMTGQNPRKGVTHSREDVAGELLDVAVTALVALHDFTDDPREAVRAYVERRSGRLDALLDAGDGTRHPYGGAGRLHGICRCGQGPDSTVHLTAAEMAARS
jgi:NTP pyrophosphatase (non-canonical NTP hydrolase)